MSDSWTCSVCGAVHEGTPLDWGFAAPAYWDEERDGEHGYLNADLCRIPRDDEQAFDCFVRGVIEIPILDGVRDGEQSFGIGAWVSLSVRNFERLLEHPEAGGDSQGEAWFGWLSNDIPIYEGTLSLQTNVYLRGARWRPAVVVQPTEHPLARDQHDGITLTRARDLSARWLHVDDA